MTRDDEIINAARAYAMYKSKEKNTWFVDYKDIEEAFLAGADFVHNSAETRFYVGVDLACDNGDTFVTNKFNVKHSKKRNKVKFYVAMDRDCSLWLYIGKPTKIKDDFMAGYQCRAIAGEDCFSEFGLDANGVCWGFCIPYNDDTKHLVGTSDEAPEYYRYWED